MGIFDFLKEKKDVVDLSGREEVSESNAREKDQDEGQENTDNSSNQNQENPEDKKRKLAMRIAGMSEKIDDISSKIYRLQQRVEVLEKRIGSNTNSEEEPVEGQ